MPDKIVAKKSLGQNFLTDPSVARSMVESLGIQKGDQVIEIGAGTGAVTQYLAPVCNSQVAHLTAVEFDIDLITILKSRIPENENVKITNANILNFLEDFKVSQNARFKIIGSLPYNITSPLIHRLIKNDPMPQTCVFLIQKEVAQKICQQAPDSNYLSVFVQTFYELKILKIVDKNLFDPVPQVDGAVIKLARKPVGMLPGDVSRYEKFLHRVFSHPRKMLNKVFTKDELEKCQLDGNKRPQNYGDKDYLRIFLQQAS
jgi:16S rRNA (adenine1518-N6/adenine1519-N6)-dimethyltransferase